MNRQDLISLAVFLLMVGVGRLATGALQRRLVPVVRVWLGPVFERIFPLPKLEPWLFEPLTADELPPKQRWFLEAHTPGFIARGFTHLGDFVLRRDHELSCVRFFLSRDATVIGGLSCYLGQQVIECVSVLLDGFYLETSTASCAQLPPTEHGLQFFPLATDDAAELIEHHLACVAKTALERGTTAAPLEAADLPAAINYGRELSLRSLHKQGVLEELPKFLKGKSPATEVLSAPL